MLVSGGTLGTYDLAAQSIHASSTGDPTDYDRVTDVAGGVFFANTLGATGGPAG